MGTVMCNSRGFFELTFRLPLFLAFVVIGSSAFPSSPPWLSSSSPSSSLSSPGYAAQMSTQRLRRSMGSLKSPTGVDLDGPCVDLDGPAQSVVTDTPRKKRSTAHGTRTH